MAKSWGNPQHQKQCTEFKQLYSLNAIPARQLRALVGNLLDLKRKLNFHYKEPPRQQDPYVKHTKMIDQRKERGEKFSVKCISIRKSGFDRSSLGFLLLKEVNDLIYLFNGEKETCKPTTGLSLRNILTTQAEQGILQIKC